MTDRELAVLCDGWIQDARNADTGEDAGRRTKAIDFYEGRVDLPSEPGKSEVVSPDVADALEGVLPGLLRVFLASDRIGIYEPRTQDDEGMAKQATDGINYEFMNECRGYSVLHSSFHDALLHGNAVIKHFWEKAPEYRTEVLTGLSEEEYLMLLDDETVEEVLEKREYYVGPDGQEIDPEADKDKPTAAETGVETRTAGAAY
jgi:hypothetical protein